jgi:hypothetical protein
MSPSSTTSCGSTSRCALPDRSFPCGRARYSHRSRRCAQRRCTEMSRWHRRPHISRQRRDAPDNIRAGVVSMGALRRRQSNAASQRILVHARPAPSWRRRPRRYACRHKELTRGGLAKMAERSLPSHDCGAIAASLVHPRRSAGAMYRVATEITLRASARDRNENSGAPLAGSDPAERLAPAVMPICRLGERVATGTTRRSHVT